jgi:Mn-containing catalase
MASKSDHNEMKDSKFRELLLKQFGGVEGELSMATAYLTQATAESNEVRKTTLVRIARRKIQHAEILAMILLQVTRGYKGPLPRHVKRGALTAFLFENQCVSSDIIHEQKSESEKTDKYGIHRFHSKDPKIYLTSNIHAEDKQIKCYRELIDLTDNPHFIAALEYAGSTQIQHKKEMIRLRDWII